MIIYSVSYRVISFWTYNHFVKFVELLEFLKLNAFKKHTFIMTWEFPFNPFQGDGGVRTRFTLWNKDRWTNVKYISKSKHKTTHFIGNTRKQCMNNINRHNTLKLAQINKLVKYHIEGDQGLNHCGYMLMNSTVNDFIWEVPDHCKNNYCTWVYCKVLLFLFASHYHW